MLLPALLELFRRGLMPADFRVTGSGRHSPGTDDEFRDQIREALGDEAGEDEAAWEDFAGRLSFVVSADDDVGDLAEAVATARSQGEHALPRRRRVLISYLTAGFEGAIRPV